MNNAEVNTWAVPNGWQRAYEKEKAEAAARGTQGDNAIDSINIRLDEQLAIMKQLQTRVNIVTGGIFLTIVGLGGIYAVII